MAQGGRLGSDLVTIFGGSGFAGRHTVSAVAKRGWRVRAAVRRPDLAGHLQPMGSVGQVHAVQSNLRYPKSIADAVAGATAVVNAVGILAPAGRQSFDAVHAGGARAVARAAREAGVKRFVHISAIGADTASAARYAQSKAAGEAAVLEEFPTAIILRPSIVFGPEDEFFNRFAALARMSPFLPSIGLGLTRFQPVYVGDVAEAFLKASFKGEAQGKTYEIGGPSIYTFKELMEYLLKIIHRQRILLPIPFSLAKAIAFFTQFLPSPPLTPDQVELLKQDNVISSHALKAEELGVYPKALEALAPLYLGRYCPGGRITIDQN